MSGDTWDDVDEEAYAEAEAEARLLIEGKDLFPDEKEILVEILEATDDEIAEFSCSSTIEFGEKVCGIRPNPEQRKRNLPWWDPLQKLIWDSVEEHANTMVFSGNGIGKTNALGLEILRRFYNGFKLVTTAPVKRQVNNLWSEIRMLREMARGNDIELPGRWAPRAHEVELNPKWTLRGYTARVASGETVATAFAGEHHDQVMVVGDEHVGIPEAVWEAADRIVVGEKDKSLWAGNPTDPTASAAGRAKMVNKDTGKPLYNVLHLSSEDHSNVRYGVDLIPGATSRKFCERQLAKGGSRESAYYRTSVLGLFPNQAEDALIRAEWIEASKLRSEVFLADRKRPEDMRKFPKDHRGVALGLDVAGEGKDLTVLMGCEEGKLFFPKLKDKAGNTLPCWHRGRDHTHAVDLIIAAIKQIPRVLSVSIDDTGLGAAVSADLWARQKEFPEVSIYIVKGPLADPGELRQRCCINRINFGAAPTTDSDGDRFGCMKDTLYWKMREDLRLGKVNLPTELEQREANLPDDADLFAQLLAPVMYKDLKGKLHILDKKTAFGGKGKEAAKHLPSVSPDVAHSSLLAWWAWGQLPERQAAPRTTQEVFMAKKEAIIAATSPKPQGYGGDPRPMFHRRAR